MNPKLLQQLLNRKVELFDFILDGYQKVSDDLDYFLLIKNQTKYTKGKIFYINENEWLLIDQYEDYPRLYQKYFFETVINDQIEMVCFYNRVPKGEIWFENNFNKYKRS